MFELRGFERLMKHYYYQYFYSNPILKKLYQTRSLFDLTSLERDAAIWKRAIHMLPDNSDILDLRCCNIPDTEAGHSFIKDLVDALAKNTTLKRLNLSNNPVGKRTTRPIANMLKVNSTLKEINLDNADIQQNQIYPILEALKANQNLRVLNLNSCEVAGLTPFLFTTLSAHKTLREVHLSNCELQIDEYFANFLKENKILKKLNVSMNLSFSLSYSMHYLIEGLRENTSLTQLNLSSCGLDIISNELQKLAMVLQKHPNLEHLNLAHNGLGSEIYPLAATIIHRNESIKYLNLTANSMEDNGLKELCEGIKNNNSLATLILQRNSVSNSGLEYLGDALQYNNSLVHLDLTENEFDSVSNLEKYLINNICITSIDYDRKKITDDSFLELDTLLRRNQLIKSSYLIPLQRAEAKNDLYSMIRILKALEGNYSSKGEQGELIWNPSQLRPIYNSSLAMIKSELKKELSKTEEVEQNIVRALDLYIKASPLLYELRSELQSAVISYEKSIVQEDDDLKLLDPLIGLLGIEDQSTQDEEIIIECFKNAIDYFSKKIVTTFNNGVQENKGETFGPLKKAYFNQADFVNKLRKEDNHLSLRALEKKHSGLCELICNYIIREDLMGLSSADRSAKNDDFNTFFPKNLRDIQLLVGLYQLDIDWVLKSHLIENSSPFEKFKAYCFNDYPYALFSASEVVNKDRNEISDTLLAKKLDELDVGCYIKFAVFTKSFGEMAGHSMLIKKDSANSYSFFDPNKGEYSNLNVSELGLKLNKAVQLNNATHMAFLDGTKYLNSLSGRSSQKDKAFLAKVQLKVINIDPLERQTNIRKISDLLSNPLFEQLDKTCPRYIRDLKNILRQIDYSDELDIVKNIIAIRKISQMEPAQKENSYVLSLRNVLDNPTSVTFANICSNLALDPQLQHLMPATGEPMDSLNK